jgi:cyclase
VKSVYRWVFALGIVHAQFAAGQSFDVKPVTEDVYAAIAKPTFRTNCNAAIFVLKHEVIVVDAESKPSAAREVIEAIKHLTDKPVKYLIITHLHGDHFQGAGAYLQAWPEVQIISSEFTRYAIENRGIPRMQRELIGLPATIRQMTTDLQKSSDPDEKRKLQTQIDEATGYLNELSDIKVPLPGVTIRDRMFLHDDEDVVEVLFAGRGHSDGDLYVYYPKRKVVATGDALQGWVPTMGDASLADWIEQLKTVEELDFKYVIGGHGDTLEGKGAFDLWREYFTELLADTATAVSKGADLEGVKGQIIPPLVAKFGSRFPPDFSRTVVGNVEAAYRAVTSQTK